jgi:hypothetical protein
MEHTGIVSLRGGKLILDGDVIYSDSLIPGDRAEIRNGVTRLLARDRQTLPGFVNRIGDTEYSVCFPILGEGCPFRIRLPHTEGVTLRENDFILVELDANGGGRYIASYDAFHNESEARSIGTAYRRTGRILDPRIDIWNREGGAAHYTQEGVADETGLSTFTVDPPDSDDFDDAITVDAATRTVYIHIVDIVAAAPSESDEYRMRQYCQTLYLANERTDHLLHDVYGASLVTGQERSVITVRVRFGPDFVAAYDIYQSRIIVKERLTYTEFATRMSDDRGDPANTFLRELLTKRSRDVAYDINLPSVRVNVGCDSEVTTHLEDTNDVAHRTVAMLMVLCNMVVSRHLRGRGVEIPNRFHANLSGVVWDRMPLRSGQPAVDSFVLVKRFARACYAIDQWGHFGLGITDYVHFTSPMRRYAIT